MLIITRSPDQRRMSYIEHSRNYGAVDPHRSLSGKHFSDDSKCQFFRSGSQLSITDHATSYLQMNTTNDSFPILVRKDSHVSGTPPGGLGQPTEFALDSRLTGLSLTPPKFSTAGRHLPPHALAHRGTTDDLDTTQQRHMSELPRINGHKSFNGPIPLVLSIVI